jgi:hypothetical protein
MSLAKPKNFPLLLIFDIDETLIQFINSDTKGRFPVNPYSYWKNITSAQRANFGNGHDQLKFEDKVDKSCVIFRPGLGEFLKKTESNPRIHVALWTFSERQYAIDIANLITKFFRLKKNPFVFEYGSEDMHPDEKPKSLKKIWDGGLVYDLDEDTGEPILDDEGEIKFRRVKGFGHKYNKFNTILLDDRLGNLNHSINKENSIIVQEFAPFGDKKQRQPLTDENLRIALDDTMFNELGQITDNILDYIGGCDEEECADAFETETIFPAKNINKLRKLNVLRNQKTFFDKPMISIGDTSNAASAHKGGKTRKTKKSKNSRKTNKSRRVRK